MVGDNGKLYICWASDVATLEKDILKIVAQLRAELGDVTYMTTWQEKLMVIGSLNFGVSHLAYMLDLINYTWTKVELPKDTLAMFNLAAIWRSEHFNVIIFSIVA